MDASFLQEQSNSDLIVVPVFVAQFLFLLPGKYIVLGHLSAQGMLGQLPKKCTGEHSSVLRSPSRGLSMFLRITQKYQSSRRLLSIRG